MGKFCSAELKMQSSCGPSRHPTRLLAAPAASTSEPPFGFSSGPNVTAVDVNRMTAADIGSLVSRALGGGAGAAGLARPAPEPRPVAAAPQPYR